VRKIDSSSESCVKMHRVFGGSSTGGAGRWIIQKIYLKNWIDKDRGGSGDIGSRSPKIS
jgi:hypothetical protein